MKDITIKAIREMLFEVKRISKKGSCIKEEFGKRTNFLIPFLEELANRCYLRKVEDNYVLTNRGCYILSMVDVEGAEDVVLLSGDHKKVLMIFGMYGGKGWRNPPVGHADIYTDLVSYGYITCLESRERYGITHIYYITMLGLEYIVLNGNDMMADAIIEIQKSLVI